MEMMKKFRIENIVGLKLKKTLKRLNVNSQNHVLVKYFEMVFNTLFFIHG